MPSDWEQAEIDYWEEATRFIPPEIVEEIEKGPPPTLRQRFMDWLDWQIHKPRGTAAIIQMQGEQISQIVKALQGR